MWGAPVANKAPSVLLTEGERAGVQPPFWGEGLVSGEAFQPATATAARGCSRGGGGGGWRVTPGLKREGGWEGRGSRPSSSPVRRIRERQPSIRSTTCGGFRCQPGRALPYSSTTSPPPLTFRRSKFLPSPWPWCFGPGPPPHTITTPSFGRRLNLGDGVSVACCAECL